MAFGSLPTDANTIPIGSVYVPGDAFRALSGSTLTNTDGAGNISAPANLNILQIGSLAANMGGTDGDTASTLLEILTGAYNGATVDMVRSVTNAAIINASGVTTTQNSADQRAYNARGVQAVINMSNVGTGSVTLRIQGKDINGSNNYYDIAVGAAQTANGTVFLELYPGSSSTAPAGPPASTRVAGILPYTWRVQATANNANATTYTVTLNIIN
jgi:hypothetical protein